MLLFTAAFGGDAVAQICARACPQVGPVAPVLTGGFASGQAALFDVGTQFLQRLGAASSFRSAASSSNNPQGGGADTPDDRYRTWFEGYGLASKTNASADYAGDHRHTWGGLAGAGITIAPGATIGLSVDQSRTKINIDTLPQHGTIDLTQIGAIGAFGSGPWNLNTMAIYGFGNVHSERTDAGGTLTTSYGARLWAGMAELSYYWALPNNSRLVPKLTFDGMHTHTDAFVETGGALPVAGSATSASRVRMMIGAEAGHSWLAGRTIMDFLVYGRFVDNLEQNIGDMQISDPTAGFAPQTVVGVRESTLGADAGATLSAKITDVARVYAVYDGRFRSNFTSHSGTLGLEFRF